MQFENAAYLTVSREPAR